MHLQRRSFLRLSAVGATALIFPLAGTGCGAPQGAVALELGSEGEHLYFDAQGSVLELQPREHRVLVRGLDGAQLATVGGFGLGPTQLNCPAALALGLDGQIYVVDRGNCRIQRYARDGAHLGQIGRPGKQDGQLLYPAGACMDAQGRLLVSDSLNHRVQVFSADGAWLSTFGVGELQLPRGIAVGPDGRIHVVDSANARIAVYDATGRRLGHYGHYGQSGAGMVWPRAITLGADGTSYVADATCAAVHVFDAEGSFLERRSLQRGHTLAAPVHLALSPAGELRVAARAGGTI